MQPMRCVLLATQMRFHAPLGSDRNDMLPQVRTAIYVNIQTERGTYGCTSHKAPERELRSNLWMERLTKTVFL